MLEETVAPPQDFSLRYEWKEASLPPPHHYELTVVVGPGRRGEIVLLPDYPSATTPVWTETFEVPEEELAALFEKTSPLRAPADRPSARPPAPSVGGQLESLTVTSGGERFELSGAATAEVSDVGAAVRSLVPEALWRQLMERRELYKAQRSP